MKKLFWKNLAFHILVWIAMRFPSASDPRIYFVDMAFDVYKWEERNAKKDL